MENILVEFKKREDIFALDWANLVQLLLEEKNLNEGIIEEWNNCHANDPGLEIKKLWAK